MESEGGRGEGRAAATIDDGTGRVLLVGSAPWLDELATCFDGLDAVVADAATARERLADERFDCVVVCEEVARAKALLILESARETDPDCATLLVADGDESVAAVEFPAVSEVVPAGDGTAWTDALAGLVRQAAECTRADRRVAFYERLTAGVDDVVVVFDADGEVTYASPSIERVTGLTPGEVVEVGACSLVHPDDAATLTEAFEELVAAPPGSTIKVETKVSHADGTWRLHEAVATNCLSDPHVEGVVVDVRDVTDPVNWKERASEGLDRLTDGFFALDADGRFTYVNEPAADLLGHPAAELLGESIWEWFPDAVDLAFHEQCRQAVESGEPVAFEEQCTSGEWFEVRAYPSESGLSVYVRDVTDRHEHERKFRAIFERAIDAIVIADDDGRYVDANRAACELFGLPREELIGRSVAEFAPEDYDFETAWEAFQEGTQERGTFDLVRPDGSERVVEFSASTNVLPDWHLSVMRDVTDRHRFERELRARTERLRTIVENVPVILFSLDEDGTFTLSEGLGLAALGLEPGEVVGTSVDDQYAEHPEILEYCRRALSGQTVHSAVEVENIVFETAYQPIFDEAGGVEGVIGVSIDVTERTRHEHTLRALNESTQGLLGLDTEQDIAEHLVATAIEVLEFPGVVVYCFDESENVLRPTAASDDGTDLLGEPPVLGGDEPSITWRSFVEGRTEVLDDVRTSEYVYDEETNFRSGLYVPLGAHGVLVVGSTGVGAFDERTRELADLLAATGEAALDRVDRESALRERDRTLQRQDEKLRRLNRVDEIIREIDAVLVQADTRPEIERAVTERLTQTDRFALAWIGDGDDRLRPSAWSGTERGYLDAVEFAVGEGREPAVRAARERTMAVVENVAAELRSEPWRKEALARTYQSALAIPLVHDGFAYGVLAVYATRPRAFDETTRAALGRLGRTVAYAIDAVERKRALLADDVTELEFSITDDNCLFLRLCRRADCRLHLEGVDVGSGDVVAFVTVADVAPERFVAVANESASVSDVAVIRTSDDGALVELHVEGPLMVTGLADRNVVLADLSAEPTGTRAIMAVPATVDVRSIVETVGTMFPDSEFLARRECSETTGGERGTRQRLLDRLTDRQREVLGVAYHGGYFESPRATTGEDLADALDVSPPAFHGHLRSVQRKLFAALLEDEDN